MNHFAEIRNLLANGIDENGELDYDTTIEISKVIFDADEELRVLLKEFICSHQVVHFMSYDEKMLKHLSDLEPSQEHMAHVPFLAIGLVDEKMLPRVTNMSEGHEYYEKWRATRENL